MQVLSALAVFSDVSASVGVAASKADELNELPAEPDPGPGLLPGPLSERRLARFGDRLIAEGLHHARAARPGADGPERHARQARHHPRPAGGPRGESLLDSLSRQHNVPTVTLTQLDVIDPDVLRLVPDPLAEKLEVLPIKRSANTLTLAMADPTNVLALDDVAFMTNLQIHSRRRLPGRHSPGHRPPLQLAGESVADMITEIERRDDQRPDS